MTTIGQKADYVRRSGQTRNHHCHWPGCEKQVPPAMWGCKTHWFKLPQTLRNKIWRTYQPGQEIDGTPSDAYLAVAQEVQDWIAASSPAPEIEKEGERKISTVGETPQKP